MNERDAFERAFVAVSYLLGGRGAVESGLRARIGASARTLSERLVSASQVDRARALAAELVPVVRALDARRFR